LIATMSRENVLWGTALGETEKVKSQEVWVLEEGR
jgi:hypothetical protein